MRWTKMKPDRDYVDFIQGRFAGQDVHIVASGPSLYGFDYRYFFDKTVIAVNHAYKLTPHDFCVFIDSGFREVESPGVLSETYCVTPKGSPGGQVQFNWSKYFSPDPKAGVYSLRGKSSGIAALSIALQGGAKMVYLHGYDYRFLSPTDMQSVADYSKAAPPKNCYYGHSTSGLFSHRKDDVAHKHLFESKIEYFRPFPIDRVVNCSPWSAIPYFVKRGINEL